ncbi:MAG: Uma2 family endonuclease [Cyanobacteria bacterium J06641_5]
MTTKLSPNIHYPDSDGQPMADNTKQFRGIVLIKENLEILFADAADVFVAGDLFWYPVEGDNTIRQAPDALVVFGRPKGDRGSYLQWEENNIAPQIVFEILSPGNRAGEMRRKLAFYDRYGVQEYYTYDPDRNRLKVWQRQEKGLVLVPLATDWTSSLLGVRFELGKEELGLYGPQGQRFLSPVELAQAREREQLAKEQALAALEQERLAKEQAQKRYQELLAKLQAQGIDPEQL